MLSFFRNRILLFTLLLLSALNIAHAEVADKCPSFVSRQSDGAWSFLSQHDATRRLVLFTAIYAASGLLIYLISLYLKRNWLKYVSLTLTIMIGLHLFLDSRPHSEPCSRYFMRPEVPSQLAWIQTAYDVILFSVPLLLFLAQHRQKK